MHDDFAALGVAPDIAKKLTELSFITPTPIQAQAIPAGLEGRDVIGIAQTGTGKTFAFGIPMIQRISDLKGAGKGLIILPTRELAEQVETTLLTIGRHFGLRTALIIGGAAMGRQVMALKRNPHVIIGTPGRIVDHLMQGTLRLNTVKMLVLDEGDRMLDMGFAPQVNEILNAVPTDRQTMLFSATMPAGIAQIVAKQLKNPIRVEIASSGTAATNVEQALYVIDRNAKASLLKHLISECTGPVIVFTRTKHGARKLRDVIEQFGEKAAEIHGNRSLPQRREALAGFKSHRYHVLVATDVAARGIDVPQVELVVNYDLPEQPEDYVHRIGRTGRAGYNGRAVSFATPDQRQLVYAIERLAHTQIPRATVPNNLPKVEPIQGSYQIEPRQQRSGDRNMRSYGARNQRGQDRRPQFGGGSYGSRPNPARQASATAHQPTRPDQLINDARDFYPRIEEPATQNPQRSFQHNRPFPGNNRGGGQQRNRSRSYR